MRLLGSVVLLLALASACGTGDGADAAEAATPSSTAAPTTTTTAPPTSITTTAVPPSTTASVASPPTSSTTTAVPPSTSTTAAPTTTAGPAFASSVRSVTREELGVSWREGCPVPVEDLRLLTVRHWTMAGTIADGQLVVHRDVAGDLHGAFGAIFAARFPITAMVPVTVYGADDGASMAADNTSAFNCRPVAGTSVWSQHSYGRAVDINPLRNPWVSGGTVDPPQGARYADRSLDEPGMIRPGDAVTTAFASIGWGWGGNWGSAKDWQHFSANGR